MPKSIHNCIFIVNFIFIRTTSYLKNSKPKQYFNWISLQWRHNERDGVSNHQPLCCFSAVYSGADEKRYQSSVSLAFVRGIHRWPVNSPHRGPVTRKTFPFDDVIMFQLERINQKGDKTCDLPVADARVNVHLDYDFKPPRLSATSMDKICRALFPALFGLFNLIYWLHPAINSRGPDNVVIWQILLTRAVLI